LRVRGLEASYGDHRALHGIDLDVPPGTCVAVLGANGAGKSTLLNSISGLHRPIRGSVTFAGRSIERRPAHVLAASGICHVPEGRGVFRDLTVTENLRLLVRQEDRRAKVLDRLPRLRERLQQRAGTLSGGEQQMLAMAPAVAGDYDLLLVDELSLGLAPIIVDELFGILADVLAEGASVVVVEQFAERALALATSAYVLRKGEVVHHGDAADLRGRDDLLRSLYLGGKP